MWIYPFNTIALILKGLIVGIIASAPMGPVGVLVVQRTLNKGRWYGFVTGLGAALSDIIYAVITGLGMTFVMDFIERPRTMLYLKIGGSVMLFFFGLFTFFVKPTPSHHTSHGRGTLLHNMFTGFLVTLSNPLIIFLFVALFARFEFLDRSNRFELPFGYLAILVGACLWWFTLSGAIDKVRARFRMQNIVRVNRFIGVVVMLASVVGLVYFCYYIL
ncbi:MAG: LysE family transporter [Bacteroidaceae bacterium]|jgi:threonine/homoserine/homoserine lactone efflux protein|nr:LysE family transporter [Bacteroidaceae bacterium]